MAGSRWIRPEVYPLFAAMGVALGICSFQLVRNISTNPEVRATRIDGIAEALFLIELWIGDVVDRVNKAGRAAGVLENFEEGQKYSQHRLRQFVRNRRPEIMPSINSFFADPQKN